jgi:hypothetical protein
MKHPLDGVFAKVERAQHHLKEIDDELRVFRGSDPYPVRIKIDPHSGNKVWYAGSPVAKPPPQLSPLIGDALYNLRSALDHLAWQLVLANPPNKPIKKQTAFPISLKVSEWSGAGRRLRGMTVEMVAAIKAEQPCYRRHPYRNRALRLLETLGNVDKHRHFNLTTAATLGGMMAGLPAGSPRVSGSGWEIYGVCVKPGTELAYVAPEFITKSYRNVNFGAIADVAFGPGPRTGAEPVWAVLRDIEDGVQEVIGEFLRFFRPRR